MKIHRAITLVLLLAVCGLALYHSLSGIDLSRGAGTSLLVVLAGAVIAGIAFSWRRYFPRRPPAPGSGRRS